MWILAEIVLPLAPEHTCAVGNVLILYFQMVENSGTYYYNNFKKQQWGIVILCTSVLGLPGEVHTDQPVLMCWLARVDLELA